MIALWESSTAFELSPTLAINEAAKARRAAGEELYHMGFGQSPFPAHSHLQAALQAATHYKEYIPTAGLPGLCEAVKSYYREKAGIDTDQFDVLIAPGSKLILYALQMAIEGDVILPVPSWVSYAPQSRMIGRAVIDVPVTLDDAGFHIDPDVLRAVIHEARATGQNPSKIILNYPNNPTGLTIPGAELEAIAAVCVEEDILIISDEIYGFVDFEGHYKSIAKYAPTHTAVSTGLSKHLSLGGWRVGVGLIPKAVEGLQGLLGTIASETWSCAPVPVQYAAIEAYKGHKDVEDFTRDCTAIHGLMVRAVADHLRTLGVQVARPQGAFYLYPDFAPFRAALKAQGVETSAQLADWLLANYGLVSLPGSAFGAAPDVLTLRLSPCDYDGAAALAAYQDGAKLGDDFIMRYAPKMSGAMKQFARAIEMLKG